MNTYRKAKYFTTLRDWLRTNMIKTRLTQREVGKLAGISQSYVSQLSSGYYTTPTLGVVRNLAEAFNDNVDDVWDLC